MAIEIREIKPVKRDLLKFVHFPIDTLYKDNPYYVPSLVLDEVDHKVSEHGVPDAQAVDDAAYSLPFARLSAFLRIFPAGNYAQEGKCGDDEASVHLSFGLYPGLLFC